MFSKVSTRIRRTPPATMSPCPRDLLRRSVECSLTFDQQTANIKAAYSEVAFRDCPLLPPYTLEEVTAMEIMYSFSFLPLSRYYILNISRESSFSSCLIQPDTCRLWYRSEEQALEERRKAGEQISTQFDRWSHYTGHGYGFDLTGRISGFALLDRTCFEGFLKTIADGRRCQSWQTMVPNKWPFRAPPTLEETLKKCRDVNFSTEVLGSFNYSEWFDYEFDNIFELVPELSEIRNVELPEELRRCQRGTREAIRIILGHTRIRRMVEDLNGKARVIQRQYRLWRWRKVVLWNPHTDIGRLNLLVRARLSHVVSD